MRRRTRKKLSEQELLEQKIEKANARIRELMPGKTLEDVSEMYRQFYRELLELRKDPDESIEDILACMDRYANVLEIADIFPEPGKDTWSDYRIGLTILSEMP